MIIEELIARLGWDLTGEPELKKFKQGMADAERGLSQFATRMTTFAAAAATAAAGAAVMLGKSVISTSAEFEGYAATLETIEGSSEKARKSLDWVAEFGKTTPYEVGEVTQAFVRLKAYGLDPMDGTLSAVGDAASAMGKGLMQGVEAIADAATGEFERLKEFGIKSKQAGDKVTFTWSQNGKELTKTVKKSSTEIVKFLKENFGQRFSGAMLRQSKTWNGMMSNLGDSWVDFKRRIGEGGFFETVKGHLGNLLDYIAKLDTDGTLDRWSKYLGDGLTWGVEAAIFTLSRLRKHLEFLTGWIAANGEWWGPIKAGLIALGAFVFPRGAAIIVLEDVLSWMEGSDSVIGAFAKSMSEFSGIDADAIGAVLAALAGGAGLAVAIGGIKGITAPIRALAGALSLLGGSAAAGGIAVLGRLGLIGAAGAGAVELGKQVSSGETFYQQGKAWIPGPEDALAWLYRQVFGGGDEGEAPVRDVNSSQLSGKSPRDILGSDYILSEAFQNYQRNTEKMSAASSAASIDQTVNDSRNQSVKVEVGGVTVNGVAGADAIVGAKVGSAIGNSAAGAAKLPPTRTVGSGAF